MREIKPRIFPFLFLMIQKPRKQMRSQKRFCESSKVSKFAYLIYSKVKLRYPKHAAQIFVLFGDSKGQNKGDVLNLFKCREIIERIISLFNFFLIFFLFLFLFFFSLTLPSLFLLFFFSFSYYVRLNQTTGLGFIVKMNL